MSKERDVVCELDLPLVKLTKKEVLGALFVHTSNSADLYDAALLKLQTWIVNFAEEQVKCLYDSDEFTESDIAIIKKRHCVISPLTLTLYLHWLQMEQFAQMTDSEKEKILLEKIPDRFRARYRRNASCRNAREILAEEESLELERRSETQMEVSKRRLSFVEFLQEFGDEVRNAVSKTHEAKG